LKENKLILMIYAVIFVVINDCLNNLLNTSFIV